MNPLVRVFLQQARPVEPLDETEGEQRREEVAELAADHGVVVLYARLVELAGRLVVAHHDLDLPAFLVHPVDGFGREVEVALENDRAERLSRLLVLGVVVFPVPLCPRKPRPLLGRRPRRVTERVEPLVPSPDLRLLEGNAVALGEHALERQHVVRPDEGGVALDRVEIVEAGVLRPVPFGRACGESLVAHQHAARHAALADEVLVGRDVEHVAGIALRADRLHPVEVERIQDGDVPRPLGLRLAREVRERIDLRLVRLERAVKANAGVRGDPLRPAAHEPHDPREGLADVPVQLRDRVLRERGVRMQFREEAAVVEFLQLVVAGAGIADAQRGHAPDLQSHVRRMLRRKVREDVRECRMAELGVRPVPDVDRRRRARHERRVFRGGDVVPVTDVADRRPLHRNVALALAAAADVLAHRVEVLVLAVRDDKGVPRPLDRQYFSRYGHVRGVPFFA